MDGVGLVPVAMGVFGIGEILMNLEAEIRKEVFTTKIGSLLPTLKDWSLCKWPIVRGSVIGFFMGMAFPMGMGLAAGRSPELTPWLWGINGAMSVLASVLAVVIALAWGISASFWTGFACYLAATAAFIAASRVRE